MLFVKKEKNYRWKNKFINTYNSSSDLTTIGYIWHLKFFVYRHRHLCSVQFSSVQSLSHVRLLATPWIAACQASLSITNSRSPKPMSIKSVMLSSHLILLSSPSPPALNLSQDQGLFKWVSSSHQVAKVLVSASISVLPMNISPLGWTGWISLQSKGLTIPQFKSINSLAFSFLYSPTLTSIHDYCKNHSLD